MAKKIKIVCYNQVEFWSSRKKALEFYRKACRACEGSERDRYLNIVWDLEDNKDTCHDGSSLPIAVLESNNLICKTDAPDGTRDFGGKIWYPKH